MQNIIPNTIYRLQNSTQANHKKGMAMWLDYMFSGSQARVFLRNLNIRIHRDITGEM